MILRNLHRVASVSTVLALALITGCGGNGPANQGAGGTVPTPTFTLTISPNSRSVTQGGSTSYTVSLTSQDGFSTAVSPTMSGLPAGATASFNPASVTPSATGATTTVTVTTADSGSSTPTPAGAYTLTVSAVSGAISRQATTALTVTAPPAPGSLTGNIQ